MIDPLLFLLSFGVSTAIGIRIGMLVRTARCLRIHRQQSVLHREQKRAAVMHAKHDAVAAERLAAGSRLPALIVVTPPQARFSAEAN